MYTELPADIRTGHPYHMYDEILAQPSVVEAAITLPSEARDEACRIIAGARRIYLVGCGTSFHGARGGADLLRHFSGGALDARAVQAFELVTYVRDLRPDDVVIGMSHSGTTAYTLAALDKANGTIRSSSQADSSNRVVVVPTATTRLPRERVSLTAQHTSSGTSPHSPCMR